MAEVFKVNTLSELEKFSQQLTRKLSKRQILLLEGPMASGKTTFVGYLVKALGGIQNGAQSNSPTYSIHQLYIVDGKSIDHIDLYRIKSDADLEATGFWDLFDKEQGLIIIEWADRLTGTWWPSNWDLMKIQFVDDAGFRTVSVTRAKN